MPTRPQGREEIRAAVLRVARELIAERGPSGFSVREVAERAGVNHALVHRHFGSKADVLEQVLTAEATAVATAIAEQTRGGVDRTPEDIGRLLDVLADYPSYWRTLVNAVLETPDVAVPGTASTTQLFSALWAETASADPASADPASADTASTAVAGATVLGWLVFGEFMAEATGADPAQVRRRVAENVAHLAG